MKNNILWKVTAICWVIMVIVSIFNASAKNKLSNELDIVKSTLRATNDDLQDKINKNDELSKTVSNLNSELEASRKTVAELKCDEYTFVYMGEYRYTYYCDERYPHICGGGIGKTASGKDTQVGWTVAADTSNLPMGSIIYIEGVGFREVMDIGSGVKGKHIDILVHTHAEAWSKTLVNGGVWVLVKNS